MFKKLLSAILAALILLGMTAYADSGFSDWAAADAAAAIAVGYVPTELQNDGRSDITRLEFSHMAIMFIAALRGTTADKTAEPYGGKPFSDTDDKYITAAYHMGILNGRGDGSFDPYARITRQEAAKIITCVYSTYTGSRLFDIPYDLSYADTADIAPWAENYVSLVTAHRLMEGDNNGFFLPAHSYTVEQSIAVFERLRHVIYAEENEPASLDGKNPQITVPLQIRNGELYNGKHNVILNGVNLGGWLLSELWMSPIAYPDESFAYSDAIAVLTRRFGAEKASELIALYEDSYIRDKDFELIEKLGFNCIRIPFWYRNFMDEGYNMLAESNDDNPGFKRLDWAIEQCTKHGIYVILDMHGCPGGQSMSHSTGISGKNELYNNSQNLAAMEKLWTEIAKRYKDNPTVAAYDIMNEPQNNGGYSGERAWTPGGPDAVSLTNAVYDRMIRAIRRIDSTHIITVEGIWSIDALPDPREVGWDNVMYQLHIYDSNEKDIDVRLSELCDTVRKKYNTAALVGEYNSRACERYAAGRYYSLGINRIKWTYKTVNAGYDSWGIYNKDMPRIDLNTATEQEIRDVFGENLYTENEFWFNLREYNIIK